MENFQYQNWNLEYCKSQNTMCGIAIFTSCFTNNHYTTITFFFIHRCFYIFQWFLVVCTLLYWSGKNKFPSWQWHCSHFSFYAARCYLTAEGTFLLCCVNVFPSTAFTTLYFCMLLFLCMLSVDINPFLCFFNIFISAHTCLRCYLCEKNKIFLPSVNTCQNAEWIAHCCFKHKILLDSTVPFLALCSPCFLPVFIMHFSRQLGS